MFPFFKSRFNLVIKAFEIPTSHTIGDKRDTKISYQKRSFRESYDLFVVNSIFGSLTHSTIKSFNFILIRLEPRGFIKLGNRIINDTN